MSTTVLHSRCSLLRLNTYHFFFPSSNVIQALVHKGLTCSPVPDLAGPMAHQRKSGRVLLLEAALGIVVDGLGLVTMENISSHK